MSRSSLLRRDYWETKTRSRSRVLRDLKKNSIQDLLRLLRT